MSDMERDAFIDHVRSRGHKIVVLAFPTGPEEYKVEDLIREIRESPQLTPKERLGLILENKRKQRLGRE
jgi:hypothetical protein